jgi:hypothetical protein
MVHTDEAAAEVTRAAGAAAVTMGARIFFAPGRFQPEAPEGAGLLAHELTHVVQQRTSPVRMALKSSSAPLTAQAAADEAEAETVEATVQSLQRQGAFDAQPLTLARAPARGGGDSGGALEAPSLPIIQSPDGPLIARAMSTHYSRDLPSENGAGPVQVNTINRAIRLDELETQVTPTQPAAPDQGQQAPSVDEIADRVYQRLKDRLSLERERRGRWL